jgi:hypothetical protein
MLVLDSVLLGNPVYRIGALSVFISVRIADTASDLSESVSDSRVSSSNHSPHVTLECQRLGCPIIPETSTPNSVWLIVPVRLAGGDY